MPPVPPPSPDLTRTATPVPPEVSSVGAEPAPGGSTDRMSEFLRRATPILSRERGLNSRSRVLLASVARDLGLPEAEFQAAMKRLQGSSAPAAADATPAPPGLAPFENWLALNLKQIPQKILSPQLEQRVYKIGESDFGLTGEVVAAALTRALTETGVRRIGTEQSQAHLAAIIERRLAGAKQVTDAQLTELLDQGRRLGLGQNEVERLVVHQIGLNLQARRQAKTTRTIAMVAIGGSLLAGVGLVVLLLVRPAPSPVVATDPGPTNPAFQPGTVTGSPSADGSRTRPVSPTSASGRPVTDLTTRPAWWDQTLIIATREAARLDGFGTLGQRIASTEATERAKAYPDLMTWIDRTRSPGHPADRSLADLASGILIREQDGSAHEAATKAVATRYKSRLTGMDLARRVEDEETAIWWAGVVGHALRRIPADDAKRSRVLAQLEDVTDRSLATVADSPTPDRELYAVTFERLMASLGAAQAAEPETSFLNHYEHLRALARRTISPSQAARTEAEFLYRALLPAKAEPSRFIELATGILLREDAEASLRVVQLMEDTESETVRKTLMDLFAIRFELSGSMASNLASVSAEVRRKLGFPPSAELLVRQQWSQLDQAIAEAGGPVAGSGRGASAVVKAAELARLATMAASLSQGDRGLEIFDELMRLKPPAAGASPAGPAAAELPRVDLRGTGPVSPSRERMVMSAVSQNQYDEAMRAFRATGAASAVDRRAGVIRFARVAHEIRQFPTDDATVLAAYLLADKGPEELAAIRENASAFAQLPELCLALSDQLQRFTNVEPKQGAVVLTAILGEPIRLGEPADVRMAQDRLLAQAEGILVSRLADRGTETSGGADATERLRQSYRQRARLFGAAATDDASVTDLTRGTLDRVRATLDAESVTKDDRGTLATLALQADAAPALPDPESARLILTQRGLVDAVGLAIAAAEPTHQAAQQRIRSDLVRRQQEVTDAAAQLALGEEALLKLWLLNRPLEGSATR